VRKPFRIALIAAVAVGGVAVLVSGFERAARERDENEESAIRPPAQLSSNSTGETVITLDAQAQARIDLRTEALARRSVRAEAVAYGNLQEDPSRSFTVRAPFAGTLQLSAAGEWPSLGETVRPGAVIGQIAPRVAPVDRVNLRDRLASAQADVESSSAALAASKAAYERLAILNAAGKSASDRAVQEAEARKKSDEARLKAAGQTVALIHSSLDATGQDPAGMLPLVAESGGQAVEILAQPGESIESGQAILRLSRFDELLAKVDLPAGQAVLSPAPGARIVVTGHEDLPVAGSAVAVGAAVDPKTQGQPLLFRVRNAGLTLRPGMAVTAYVQQRGAATDGVVVPRESIVRFGGAAWAYVQTAPDGFTRRQLLLDRPISNGWFSTSLRGGDRVVVAGAQTLLSEELKSQIQVGEASEAQ
jgi:hypothetical protein